MKRWLWLPLVSICLAAGVGLVCVSKLPNAGARHPDPLQISGPSQTDTIFALSVVRRSHEFLDTSDVAQAARMLAQIPEEYHNLRTAIQNELQLSGALVHRQALAAAESGDLTTVDQLLQIAPGDAELMDRVQRIRLEWNATEALADDIKTVLPARARVTSQRELVLGQYRILLLRWRDGDVPVSKSTVLWSTTSRDGWSLLEHAPGGCPQVDISIVSVIAGEQQLLVSAHCGARGWPLAHLYVVSQGEISKILDAAGYGHGEVVVKPGSIVLTTPSTPLVWHWDGHQFVKSE